MVLANVSVGPINTHTLSMVKRFPFVFVALLSICPLMGEEGGSGHYLPGSMASFMDGVAPTEAFLIRYQSIWYDADIDIPMTIAGLQVAGNVEAESWANALTFFWRPPIEIGENLSYAVSATIPFVSLDVEADVRTRLGTERRSDSESGLGDIVFQPLMLNYAVNEDFNINTRLSIYAPTGDYEKGRLANPGKNYWTFEPKIGFMYFGQQNGREASIFTGLDFNTENDDTDYHTGMQWTVDGTLAQHFPLAGGLMGAGLSGYWYEQIEGDSGSGATLGDFKGRTAGAGAALSFVKKTDHFDFMAELKWLHEIETRNRLKGDYLWLKVALKF